MLFAPSNTFILYSQGAVLGFKPPLLVKYFKMASLGEYVLLQTKFPSTEQSKNKLTQKLSNFYHRFLYFCKGISTTKLRFNQLCVL